MVQLLWKIIGQFLKKLKIKLLYDPAILLLDIYPKEFKTESQRGNCTTTMFIVVGVHSS